MNSPSPNLNPSDAEQLLKSHGVSLPETLRYRAERAAFLRDWVIDNQELSDEGRASLTRRVIETDGMWNERDCVSKVYEDPAQPRMILISYTIEGEDLITPLSIKG